MLAISFFRLQLLQFLNLFKIVLVNVEYKRYH